jgi:eukaryotic-like serine/threonine-protein kinase
MERPLEQSIKKILAAAESDDQLACVRTYDLDKHLKDGGMGAVYSIKHRQTGERAAVKLILPYLAVDPAAVELFRREIVSATQLSHQNIVGIKGSGYAEGVLFLAMEYCNGGSVSDLMLSEGGKIGVDAAIEIILQALRGLEYLHHAPLPRVELNEGGYTQVQGLVHRDLKPQNLLLSVSDGSRSVKISDFGLSKAYEVAGWSGVTLTGQYGGTAEFMPREQLTNYKYARPDVDVWSLAACLYYMASGFFPRDFPRGQDRFTAIEDNDPVPIRKRDPSIPTALAEIIDEALREDEKPSRLRTAAGLRLALEDYVRRNT